MPRTRSRPATTGSAPHSHDAGRPRGLADVFGGVRGLRGTRRQPGGCPRAAAIGREVDELRGNSPLAGTPDEIVDKLGAFAEIGVQRVYLQLLDMSDLDHLDLFASEVLPQLD